ncbi:MAG: septum site-determining protein MinC [Anaerolineae bacterium]|nr:septum site-determining protein MinC [Anaerolineae bacterium]
MDDSITLKGIKDGLLVTVKPDGKWADLVNRLADLIDSQGGFFAGAQVTLALGLRDVRRNDLAQVQRALEKRDVTLVAVLSDSPTAVAAARKLKLRTELATVEMDTQPIEALPLKPPPIDPEERGTAGVLINHTVRNGRTVHSAGHIVILGDVNAGAVIVAGGDIIIWGKCRGVVHAGANGDESAVVCALHLTPTQLRIAGHITISPDDRRRHPKPEMAMVRHGRIEAVSWED